MEEKTIKCDETSLTLKGHLVPSDIKRYEVKVFIYEECLIAMLSRIFPDL